MKYLLLAVFTFFNISQISAGEIGYRYVYQPLMKYVGDGSDGIEIEKVHVVLGWGCMPGSLLTAITLPNQVIQYAPTPIENGDLNWVSRYGIKLEFPDCGMYDNKIVVIDVTNLSNETNPTHEEVVAALIACIKKTTQDFPPDKWEIRIKRSSDDKRIWKKFEQTLNIGKISK